jgi:hypothetical protein
MLASSSAVLLWLICWLLLNTAHAFYKDNGQDRSSAALRIGHRSSLYTVLTISHVPTQRQYPSELLPFAIGDFLINDYETMPINSLSRKAENLF